MTVLLKGSRVFQVPLLGRGPRFPYIDTLLSGGPIALWRLSDRSGSTAVNAEGTSAKDGTHTGVSLADAKFKDGSFTPLFDGVNDYVNIYTTGANSLEADFDGDVGSFSAWIKVSAAGVWTDGNPHYVFSIASTGGSNKVVLLKTSTNNQLQFSHTGSSTTVEVSSTAAGGSTDWIHVAMTWDTGADEFKAFINGTQVGGTQTGMGTWSVSTLSSAECLIGAAHTAPTFVWDGWIANATVYDAVLAPTTISSLQSVKYMVGTSLKGNRIFQVPLNGEGPQPTFYYEQVLGFSPIAYWPLWETTGSNADNLEGTASLDGTYVGVTLDDALFVNGVDPVPFFDGANDAVSLPHSALNGVINKSEGTVISWFKVADSGVWSDGTDRVVAMFRINDSNEIIFWKPTSSGYFNFRFQCAGTSKGVTKTGISETGWVMAATTWSVSGDEVRHFWNGVQEGSTQTSISAMSGTFGECDIGARNTTWRWNGWIGHTALFDTPLTPTQIADLYIG